VKNNAKIEEYFTQKNLKHAARGSLAPDLTEKVSTSRLRILRNRIRVDFDSFEKPPRPLRRLRNTHSRHKIQNLSKDTVPLKSIKLHLILA
jgi:hypothetical protein